jgi:Protein of unknown function (DUF3592)
MQQRACRSAQPLGGLMRIVNGILGTIAVLVGIFQLCWCVWDSAAAIAATRWSTTVGTVKTSEVFEDRGGRGVGYVPRVAYTFTINGQARSGNRFYNREARGTASQAQQAIRAYSAGARVKVYYNPANPAESLLSPGLWWYSYLWFGLSLLAIVLGLNRLRASLTKRDAPNAPPNKSMERTRRSD